MRAHPVFVRAIKPRACPSGVCRWPCAGGGVPAMVCWRRCAGGGVQTGTLTDGKREPLTDHDHQDVHKVKGEAEGRELPMIQPKQRSRNQAAIPMGGRASLGRIAPPPRIGLFGCHAGGYAATCIAMRSQTQLSIVCASWLATDQPETSTTASAHKIQL